MRLGPGIIAALLVGGIIGHPTAGRAEAQKLNPFGGNAQAIEEGKNLYTQHGCSACHGVKGGGGMGVPLIDDVWKFGSDDETLYKLIKGQIDGQTMPRIWTTLEDEQVWKIVAYIRELYKGDPSRINW
jgi:mono/diheme cytochrome c family protein